VTQTVLRVGSAIVAIFVLIVAVSAIGAMSANGAPIDIWKPVGGIDILLFVKAALSVALPLHEDLLMGAGPIAKELFGRDNRKNKRRIYHLHEKGLIPTWRQCDAEGKEKGPLLSKRSLLRQRFAGPPDVTGIPDNTTADVA
jgi:hypothetical protein